MLTKCVFLSVALAIVFSLSACGPAPITFADPNLEATIREAIDKPVGAILTSDVEGLTSLIASERGIADLTGLEHCGSLTELNVTGSQISDITSLASLSNLLVLNLKGNQIGDVSPLASLTSLKGLNLVGNQISDV